MTKQLIGTTLVLLTLLSASPPACAVDVNMIEPAELLLRIGSPDLFVVDVRTPSSWNRSDHKIPGAIRANPKDVTELEQQIPPGSEVVLYCA
ncbi:MAG: hypothetical protein KKE73_01405 [Proteobacteria bacterium]|nr:hypothetical protein [Pseudomonadota bacterium]